MTSRPDLVDVWIFRVPPDRAAEVLLLRRAPHKLLAGLWQCVSGSLDAGERIALGALRELEEETGFAGPDAIEAFYDLDQTNQFHEPSIDALLSSAIFAVRVGPAAEPVRSAEHDAHEWLGIGEARARCVWPGYRESIDRVATYLLDPALEPWFRLGLDGRRLERVER